VEACHPRPEAIAGLLAGLLKRLLRLGRPAQQEQRPGTAGPETTEHLAVGLALQGRVPLAREAPAGQFQRRLGLHALPQVDLRQRAAGGGAVRAKLEGSV
jgi:hypothetical protein